MANIRVKNVNEVLKKLSKFSDKLTIRITRSAFRNGANLTLKAARREAPKKSGRLRKAIKINNIRKMNPKKNGLIGLKVYISPGKSRDDPKGAYYRHAIVSGSESRNKKPNPFMDRAYIQTRRRAAKLVVKNVETAGQILANKI